MFKVGDEVFVKGEIKSIKDEEKYPFKVKFSHMSQEIFMEEELIPAGKTYTQGLADAWELTKKIVAMGNDNRDSVFGYPTIPRVMEMHTAEEAIAKIEAYEKEKEIKLGMIVVFAEEKWIVAEIKEDMLKLWSGKEILEARKSSCEPTKGVVEVSNVLGR